MIIPAYNEEHSIGRVLDDLKKEGWKNLIVVDDGSTDATARIARSKGALVVSHLKNSGLGAALRTGLEKAKELGARRVVTFDADGQHDSKSVAEIVSSLDMADLVIGVRRNVNIPLHKRFGNFVLDFITFIFSGLFTDSQSGNRGFSKRALERVDIKSDRYEVSSEIIIQASKLGLRIKTVPVKCYYNEYSKGKGTTILSGIKIFWKLLVQKVRFRR